MWSSLLGDACPSLAIPIIDAGGNEDFWNKREVECDDIGECLDETLRRRLVTLSEKNKAKDAAETVWVLQMAVRWCIFDVLRSFYFSREDLGRGINNVSAVMSHGASIYQSMICF